MKSNNKKGPVLDFGFNPKDTEHHFLVYIKPGDKEVYFFEQFSFTEDQDFSVLAYTISGQGSTCKCLLNHSRWDLIKADVRAEFNRRLKEMEIPSSQWKSKYNYLHRLLGKELLVLAWAIEEADPATVPLAIQNWLGLKPEERWWLYTITNAATGHAINGRGKGWRKALRFALTENPVTHEKIDMNIYKESNILSLFKEDPDSETLGSKHE
ncbi:MAG TPA: DUF3780 domain-containing protein [Bacteroidales bacterium]|nr:DUF3780 domain-containing protein [Bacteroidales bacterium]HSA43823.1 DUF3780 domain-containing protein [Bacteroidales bacterium]